MRVPAWDMRSFRGLRLFSILLLAFLAGCQRREASDEPAVRQIVTEFGQELKQVPLSAELPAAIAAIEKHYRRLVSPSLLEEWIANPSAAPGRIVSSPWPDRIEIDSVLTVSANRYRVLGRVIEVTSVDLSQHLPGTATSVEIALEKQNGRWLITQYSQDSKTEYSQDNRTEETAPVPEDAITGRIEAPDSVSAAAVLDTYYEAINQKEYARAYTLWASHGEASGKTLEQFAAGFIETYSVSLIRGQSSPIEAAAGSRYIEIPVTIEARLSGGRKQHFSGTYTLRRSVVDGATLEQRQWRIYKAHLVEGRAGYGMR